MVDPGDNGTPEDREREVLQRVENLLRVATSRAIALREVFERRHLQAAYSEDLDSQLIELRTTIDQILDQLLDAWGEFSLLDDELASEEEPRS